MEKISSGRIILKNVVVKEDMLQASKSVLNAEKIKESTVLIVSATRDI